MTAMPISALPPSQVVRDILIWHQGALGDLLLSGPALAAVSCHYPQARIIGWGHPERWRLLAPSLHLDQVWDSGDAVWAHLFSDSALPLEVTGRLARFQMALVFSPRPRPALLGHLSQAGIPAVHWIPAFPDEGREGVAAVQARHLRGLGLHYTPEPLRLVLENQEGGPKLHNPGTWVAVGPGSGHPCKNWPLAHYYELTRALAWQQGVKVVWLAGPAEEGIRPYLRGLAEAQGHLLLADLPLAQVAAVLSRCALYIGGDSGLTHLAAAVGGCRVLALFGPTEPRVWAPLGEQVKVLTGPCSAAPCAQGREIHCPEPQCLKDLSVEVVLTAAVEILERG
jgi:ADP-heptose:LPS heptosyltransferase